ncbi:hypothetical protein [Nocardia sp. NBC_01327]|uniref:hypothetical protein n=1 Tax=Nocardia sp. NBC_01327 TaxID=2903593 RepID=UPI002E14046F|nr:hypothetical protein OG326_42575 [Nocardia sp. NBC_01327]
MLRINFLDPILGEHDAGTFNTTAPVGAPTDLLPAGAGPKSLIRVNVPSILVLGSGGGVGVTTTALGLASAAATGQGIPDMVAVDATAWGGDLGRRGCDAQATVSSVQSWLCTPQPGLPSAVTACSGRTSTGVHVMTRTADPLPGGDTFVSVHRHLEDAHITPVFDGGGHVGSALIAPLIADPRIGLAIVVAARADSLNSLNHTLGVLVDRHGEWLIQRTVIVVCRQIPGNFGAGAVEHVRAHLHKWVRDVVDVPYDRHLGGGGALIWERLDDATRTSFRLVLGGLL